VLTTHVVNTVTGDRTIYESVPYNTEVVSLPRYRITTAVIKPITDSVANLDDSSNSAATTPTPVILLMIAPATWLLIGF
jgi:hypothetical protein